MNDSSEQRDRRTGLGNLLATVWPPSWAVGSLVRRRKTFAVRFSQLAVVLFVAAGVARTIAWPERPFSAERAAALVLTGLGYIAWSVYLMWDAGRWFLWERGAGPQPAWPLRPSPARIAGFAVQLALAGLILRIGEPRGYGLLVWAVALPPVAFSVLYLHPPGVAVVSAVSVGLLIGNAVNWQGWAAVPGLLLPFFSAVLFTLVLMLLAVSSERARGEVERYAGELGEANRQLRQYAVQAEELAATRERNRLAREIHDSLGHYLTVVNVQLEAGRAVLERDPKLARDALDKAQAFTRQGLQEIRHSVAALRASPLDEQTLVDALRRVVEESRAGGLAAELHVLGESRTLTPQIELTLYRAAQEGLTNVRKHARAAAVRLLLDFRPASVCLSVSDDGVGAAGAEREGGFGLLGLRERTQLLGGQLRVRTAPGEGFTLEVEAPA
jgi:signal transduction histidine kinase